MTWLRVDDGMVDHPKVETLSDAAFRVHMRALSYCARWSTDGNVPAQKVAAWGKPRVLAECVTAGLWHAMPGVYVIHDFLDYNPSKADLDKKAIAGAKGAAIRYGKTGAMTGANHSAISPARDPDPTRPDPTQIPDPFPPNPPRGARRRGAGRSDPIKSPKIRAAIDAIEGGARAAKS